MVKFMSVIAVFLILGGLGYYFIPLEIFNFLVPKDAGSFRAAKDVAYGSALRNRLDVYAPKEGQHWPVIVFIHGGSWGSGNKNPYEFVGRALAAQGFLAVVANYRLHPQDPFPAFVEDAAATLIWAHDHAGEFGGDATQLFAMGHSAGAYNVALAVLDKRYLAARFDVAASIKGVATLAGPFDFLPLDDKVTIDVFGQVADLPATQPVNFARADAPPFLILHGSTDTTVFPHNAVALDKALREIGNKSALKIYQGVSHVGIMLAMAKPLRGQARTLEDVVEFFRELAAK